MRPPAPMQQAKVKQHAELHLLKSRNQLLSARILDKLMSDPKFAEQFDPPPHLPDGKGA